MMVEALEENVMKDILSMGLEQKNNYQTSTAHFVHEEVPADLIIDDDTC